MQTLSINKNFVIPFGVIMNILIVIFVVFTAVAIHFPWFYISKHSSIELISEINKEITKNVSAYTATTFDQTESTLLLIDSLISDNIIDINHLVNRQRLFLSLLQSNAHISWLGYGWPNGDFIGAQRLSNGEIRFHSRKYNKDIKKTKNTTYFYDKDANNKLNEVSKISSLTNFVSFKRSWYKRAIQASHLIWTPIYIFSTSQKPGMSTAISNNIINRVTNKSEFNGVLTIAIELARLSKFTAKIQIGKTGQLFIIDSDHKLIASKDFSSIVSKVNGKAALTNIDAIKNNNELRIIHDLIKQESIKLYKLKGMKKFEWYDESSSERYHIIIKKVSKRDLFVVTIVPEEDFLAEIEENTKNLLLLIIFIIALSLIIGSFIVQRFIVAPISIITKNTEHIQMFELDDLQESKSSIREINQLSDAVNGMKNGLNSFVKYLPINIVKDLIVNKIDARVGGEEKVVTVFFSDIANFTNISEELGVKLFPHLEEYFENMANEIKSRKGTIDKYIGDAIMAFWNAPASNPNHPSDACITAIKCQHKLKRLRLNWKRNNKPPLITRIGINTGHVIVGNIGSDYKMDYTILGDSVNLASRLEAINKVYGTDTIISDNTYELAKDNIITRKLDIVAVKGKKEGVGIHELIDTADSPVDYHWVDIYEDGLSYMQAGQLEKAIKYFETVNVAKGSQDMASTLMINRCQGYIKNNNFTPIFEMKSK